LDVLLSGAVMKIQHRRRVIFVALKKRNGASKAPFQFSISPPST